MIAKTVPCPVRLVDQISSTMPAIYHRGSQWGYNHAKTFYEEVKERVNRGEAACPNEKFRLMWLGRGLWHNTAFYQHFEEEYNAVFVCSMYLSHAADSYSLDLKGDPLRSLAARHVFFGGGDDWLVKEAKSHKVNGAVMLVTGNCVSDLGTIFTRKAFEEAGIPVVSIYANNVDAREWDDARIKSQVSNFIKEKLQS